MPFVSSFVAFVFPAGHTWLCVSVPLWPIRLRAGRGAAGADKRSAHRRLRPRAGYAQPVQHPYPRGHPDLRHRGADDHRRQDERRPAAGRGSPVAGQRRRGAAPGRRDGRDVEAPSGCDLARRHAVHVGRRQIHRRGDQRPGLQPREHGRLRSHLVGGHARSAHRGRALQGDLRAVCVAVRPRHPSAARPAGPRYRSRERLQSRAARHRPLPRCRMEERRVHPARAGGQVLARAAGAGDQADPVSLRRQHQHPDQPAQDRRSAPRRDVPGGQAPRGRRDSRRHRSPHAGQRLRARDAQPAPHRRVQGRARPPRVDARHRSRADREIDPRRPGADHARADSAGVVGLHRRHGSLPLRRRHARGRCSTKPAGASPRRAACARRTAHRSRSR